MKIAIAGYGLEGKSNYEYFRTRGEVTIVDERSQLTDVPEGALTLCGPGAFEQLADFDMVVRTAGLAPRKIKTTGQIWSATNEFFAQCPAPIIGVTGSKGKGTISSFIAAILRAGGYTVHLVGNIGQPALDVLPTIQPSDIIVYELSSFQLWDIEISPHVAVVGMIEPDHLDVHASMDEYVAAKANITRYQKIDDTLVYYTGTEASRLIGEASPAVTIPYPSTQGAYCKDAALYFGEQKMCSIDAVKIPGEHNLLNACAAIAATHEWVTDGSVIAEGLAAFTGLPHRLKFIREVDGVKFYDDSIATTPGSAIAAIHAFPDPKTLILGGSDKGADFTTLIKLCHDTSTQVIAIGHMGEVIAELCDRYDVSCVRVENGTMADIVHIAAEHTVPGGVVILSPACASFDMFKNYADRGEQFIAAVQAL